MKKTSGPRVYQLRVIPDLYVRIAWPSGDTCPLLHNAFDGEPLQSVWHPFGVRLITDGGRRKETDYPGLDDVIPVFSQRAAEAIMPLIEGEAELLSIDSPIGRLYLLNVIRIVNALNEIESDFERYPDGRIAYVNRPVLQLDRVPHGGVFKISHLNPGPVFFCDDVVAALRAANCIGFTEVPVECR
jgi:hypothetical protein